MELLWAIVKFVEYCLIGPVWWLAANLAGMLFPFEGDWRHNMLAVAISAAIFGLMVWGIVLWMR